MFEIPESMMGGMAEQLGRWMVEHEVLKEGDTLLLEKVADKITVKTSSGLEVGFTDYEIMTSHKPITDFIAERLKACLPKS